MKIIPLTILLHLFFAHSTNAQESQFKDPWLWSMLAASSADLVITEIALANYNFTESNPIVKNRVIRIVSRTAGTYGIYRVAGWFEHRGNTKIANTVRIFSVTTSIGAAGWNVSLIISK